MDLPKIAKMIVAMEECTSLHTRPAIVKDILMMRNDDEKRFLRMN